MAEGAHCAVGFKKTGEKTMKSMVLAVLVGLGCAGGARADIPACFQPWVTGAGTGVVVKSLVACGVPSNSVSDLTSIEACLSANTNLPLVAFDVVRYLPLADRAQFRGVVEALCAARYPKQSEFGRLLVKYNIMQGVSMYKAATDDELVRCLLAAESMPLTEVEACKRVLKERAVPLARMKLRAEGKSFVVKNGVNPLTDKVLPVVTALNAPECAGLEDALRGLGATVQDVDRQALRNLAAVWQPKMLSGEMGQPEAALALGKLAVVLGPDAYNQFVDVYNNGTGAH